MLSDEYPPKKELHLRTFCFVMFVLCISGFSVGSDAHAVQAPQPADGLREQVWHIAVNLPSDWALDKHSDEPRTKAWVLTVNTFHGNYLRGGLLPEGGAEISVIGVPIASQAEASDREKLYLQGDSNITKERIKFAGSCTVTLYRSEASFGGESSYKRRAVFVPIEYGRGLVLYKFLLSYNPSTKGISIPESLEAVFRDIVSSASFTLPPKRGCAN